MTQLPPVNSPATYIGATQPSYYPLDGASLVVFPGFNNQPISASFGNQPISDGHANYPAIAEDAHHEYGHHQSHCPIWRQACNEQCMPISLTNVGQENQYQVPIHSQPLLPVLSNRTPSTRAVGHLNRLDPYHPSNTLFHFGECQESLVALPIPITPPNLSPRYGTLFPLIDGQEDAAIEPVGRPSDIGLYNDGDTYEHPFFGLSSDLASEEAQWTSIPNAYPAQDSPSSSIGELDPFIPYTRMPTRLPAIVTDPTNTLFATVRISKQELGAWKCDVCQGVYRRKQRALLHYLNKHVGARLQCNSQCGFLDCRKSFTSREGLDAHLTSKKAPCKNCGRLVLSKNLHRHSREHCRINTSRRQY